MTRQPPWMAIIIALAAGCTGAIEDPGVESTQVGPGGDVTGGKGGSSGGGTGGNQATGGNAALTCTPSKAITTGPAPLRRLTRVEYDYTVADLLGDTSKPGTGFALEAKQFGFDNIAGAQIVTLALAGDYFEAAETLAAKAASNTNVVPACTAGGEDACARTFIKEFGKRAYRRPLADTEVTGLLATYTKLRAADDYKTAIAGVIHVLLSSPDFLYRAEFGDAAKPPAAGILRLSSWEMASRLSYLLWSTMPDETLFAAAEAGELATKAQVLAQAQRMLADPRGHRVSERFSEGWLFLEKLDRVEKDAKLYPGFDAVRPAMREEIERFVDNAFWNTGDPSLENLFKADYSFMNKPLAAYLKVPGSATMTATFQRVPLAGTGTMATTQRAGLLSTAGLLAAHSKPLETSPILRGKFVMDQFACVVVPPPPPDVNTTLPVPSPNQTTRERFLEHQKDACAGCHKIMDPAGFAFEAFDTTGRARETENGRPIDASGILATNTDIDGPFAGPAEFANKLANSADVRACVSKQWFRYAQGREESDADAQSLRQLSCAFNQGKHSLRELLIAVTQADSFMYKSANTGGAP